MPGGRARRPASAGSAARRCGSDRRWLPVQSITRWARSCCSTGSPLGRQRTRSALPAGSIEAIRPAWVVTRAGGAQGRQGGRDRRRHAVAVDVPPGPDMAHEPRLVGRGSARPTGSARAAGRRRSPRASRRRWPRRGAPRGGRRGTAPAASGDRRRASARSLPGLGGRVAERQQPAARDRVDRPLEALLGERQADIDHGQPGAEHDHRQAGLERCGRGRRPGIGDVARRAVLLLDARCPAPGRRRRSGRRGRCRSPAGSRRWPGGSRSPRR